VRQAIRQKNGQYQGLVESTPRGPRWTGEILLVQKALHWPQTIKTPKKIFVASMSDPFHESLVDRMIDSVFIAMSLAYWHTYLLLTKRPATAQKHLCHWANRIWGTCSHFKIEQRRYSGDVDVWPGISCSIQKDYDDAIERFTGGGFSIPWVSLEPLIGPIDVRSGLRKPFRWVVIGGETGPRARPCEIDWIRAIVQQCKEAGVPCFVKQLGGRRHKNDNPDEWPKDLRVREWPDTKK
jgi:protein gp37